MDAGVAATGPVAVRGKNSLLALLAVAQFMVVLDASIVNVALPSIGADLDFAQDDLSWVVNAYVLAFGGFLLLGGRVADLVGRRRVFVIGLLAFAAASLLAGLAQSPGWLTGARVGQGLAAAFLSPAALSIIVATFREGPERNRALGVWGAVAGAGAAAGVFLGGVLTSVAGWEWVFFVNVPVALGAAALAPSFVPESRSEEDRKGFDLPGAVTVTAGVSLLVYAIVKAADVGWASAQTIIVLIVAAVLLALFVAIEQRTEVPLVRLGLFRIGTVAGANIVIMTAMAALFAMFFFVSLYMQQVLDYTAFEAGVAFLPMALTFVIGSGIGSQLVGRIGFRPVIVVGLVLVAVGLSLFSRVSADGTFLENVLPAELVSALGGGMALVGLIIAGTSGVPARESGLASGLINASQQIGGALGLAVLASVATSRTDDVLAEAGDPSAIPGALTEGFQAAFLVGAGVAILGAVVALGLIHAADSRLHRTACEEDYEAQLAEDRGIARTRVPAFGGIFCRVAFLRLIERPQPTGVALAAADGGGDGSAGSPGSGRPPG
ncbi:MAG: MFS transporter [Thermoleophilia bacterium]|nr:MFS transporter [Thermoleophilia bacterium]